MSSILFKNVLLVCLYGFYDIPKFAGYLKPIPFLNKVTVLYKVIQFRISSEFNRQNQFYSKLFSLVTQFLFKQCSLV